MLLIRLNAGWTLKLGRKLSESAGFGLWDFHCSESSYCLDQGRRSYRYARIKPADPGEGKSVEVTLLDSSSTPEDQWISVGEGVAYIHPSS